jgi:hypothetical protein
MNKSTPEEPVLSETELAYLLVLVWETVHLEMNGPAHQLAVENGFTRIQMERMKWATGKRFKVEMSQQDCSEHQGWPWPNLTPQEILADLEQRKGRQDR